MVPPPRIPAAAVAAREGAPRSAAAFFLFQRLIAVALPAVLPPWLPLALIVDIAPDPRVFTFAAFEGYTEEEAAARRARLIAGLETLPAVTAVAFADQEPLGDDSSPTLVRRPGGAVAEGRGGELTTVSANYFSVLEIPIVRGRAFTEQEVATAAPGARPAIVSETTARNLSLGGDPLGQRLLVSPPERGIEAETLEVVGVAADAQREALGRSEPYSVFVPGAWGSALLVKSRADFAATAAAIRSAVRAVDPALLVNVLPLEATLGWSRGIARTVTTLFGGLGVQALVLAAVGIYGMVAYAVTKRYREIGIRLALGARAADVLALVLRQTMRPVAIGALVGIAGAAGLARVLSSVLFGVSPADAAGFGVAAVFVCAVALAAGLVATRPAARTDPTVVLQYE
jgi:putative ABC transport system permease protein